MFSPNFCYEAKERYDPVNLVIYLKVSGFCHYLLTKSSFLNFENSERKRSNWFLSKKKCQEEKGRSFDNEGKLNMMAISKVYQTLYQINEQRILFLLIKKSKLSDVYLKKVIPL